jgi:hypothetical protein
MKLDRNQHHRVRGRENILTMKRAFSLFFPLALLAFFAGCSSPYYIVLINDTGAELRVLQGDVETAVSVGGNVQLKFNERVDEVVFIAKGTRFSYKWEYPAPEFIEKRASSRGFVIQVDPSLKAYAVLPMARERVGQLPVQPKAFPLAPILKQ